MNRKHFLLMLPALGFIGKLVAGEKVESNKVERDKQEFWNTCLLYVFWDEWYKSESIELKGEFCHCMIIFSRENVERDFAKWKERIVNANKRDPTFYSPLSPLNAQFYTTAFLDKRHDEAYPLERVKMQNQAKAKALEELKRSVLDNFWKG